MNFKGKTAIVTGSTRGIGRAAAEAFARQGANVMLCGTGDSVVDTAQALADEGLSVSSFSGDLTVTGKASALVEKTIEVFGSLDILVNNAGVTADRLLIRMEEEDWDRVLDTNLKSVFLLTKAASRIMMKKRSGRIINITSVTGLMGNAGQANYAASKAGLVGFTKSVARELASRAITCNAIAPGFIDTQMTAGLPDELKENYLKSIPLGRYGTPSDVADLVLFLASEHAQYITGQVINVDGGLYM